MLVERRSGPIAHLDEASSAARAALAQRASRSRACQARCGHAGSRTNAVVVLDLRLAAEPAHSPSSRRANAAVNFSGMCCTMTMPERDPRAAPRSRRRAARSVPPVDAPIATHRSVRRNLQLAPRARHGTGVARISCFRASRRSSTAVASRRGLAAARASAARSASATSRAIASVERWAQLHPGWRRSARRPALLRVSLPFVPPGSSR